MPKQKLVIVGAGLSGALLAARLRNHFAVTVVELTPTRRPLLNEIVCDTGGINTTINRASGLGGTTSYWHNALIELDDDELRGALLDPVEFAPWYRQAWRIFLNEQQLELADTTHRRHLELAGPAAATVAHMVVPQHRANMWTLAQRHFPGDPIEIVYGRATRFVQNPAGGVPRLLITTEQQVDLPLDADRYILAAGGLATPLLLARSVGWTDGVVGHYHDHPMAYIAKVRLRPGSHLKTISCRDTAALSIRSGFTHRHNDLKAGFYLRPALSLGLRSITGGARYILSDLRNDPFSPRKILQLLSNPEAIREGLLFKSRAGFRGDLYSILLLGEQHPRPDRGTRLLSDGRGALDWSVDAEEHQAYHAAWQQFLDQHRDELVEVRTVPESTWEYRTAAHHSGGAARFQAEGELHAVRDLPGVLVADASALRRGGIANSGLTLTAMALRLADALERGAI